MFLSSTSCFSSWLAEVSLDRAGETPSLRGLFCRNWAEGGAGEWALALPRGFVKIKIN